MQESCAARRGVRRCKGVRGSPPARVTHVTGRLWLQGCCESACAATGSSSSGWSLVALVVAAAVLAPWLAPFDPLTGDLRNAYLLGPGGRFLLGTDTQGRDVLSRVLYGARLSLSVGLISQSVSVTLGVLLGLLAGYYGRWVDALVMRLADVTLAFPDAAAAHRRRRRGQAVAAGGLRGDRRGRAGPAWRGWSGARCWCSSAPSSCSPPRRSAPATGVSCCDTCCPTCGRR